jgi:flagellar FliJ protein
MTPMQPLLTLLAHAERERNAVMADAKRIEQEHRQALRQAEQLLGYRRDYEQRWSSQFSQSGGIDIVQCYQGFVTRLGQAIEAQERLTRHAAQRLEQAQEAWQQQEMRVASVRKLIERRSRELRGDDDRREQKQLDEHAARLLWGRSAGAGLLAPV